jgi:hypothetical protein
VQHHGKQRRRTCRILYTRQRHLVPVTPCLVILVGIGLGSAGCAKPPGRQLSLAATKAVIARTSSPAAIEAGPDYTSSRESVGEAWSPFLPGTRLLVLV